MDELLIEKVKQHEVLYNYTLTDYRDPRVRQDAWDEIGKELQIKAKEAKELWDKLRRCFCNAVNRRRDRKSAQAIKKPWKFEQQMSFIMPYNIENRKQQGNANDCQRFEDYTSETNVLKVDLEDDETEQNLDRLLEDEDEHEEIELKRKIPIKRLQATKRRKQRVDSVSQMLDIMNKHQSQTSNNLEKMDDTDLFFLSMSRMTKKLPKIEQCNIKLTLSNAVLQAEMRNSETLIQQKIS